MTLYSQIDPTNSKMDLYEANLVKIRELLPEVQSFAFCWLEQCWSQSLNFKILEAYRPQARQDALFAQGRTKKGPIVTYIRSSNHTKRLAVDILPINTSYKKIEEVATRFGITHPFTKGSFIDLPHFEFTSLIGMELQVKPEARLKALKRRLQNTTSETSRNILEGVISRLEGRLNP